MTAKGMTNNHKPHQQGENSHQEKGKKQLRQKHVPLVVKIPDKNGRYPKR